MVTDPDDNKFFDAAVAGKADFIVTNDAHFNEAKKFEFPNVNIISADEFLEILKREKL
ncbi:PIN domain-containing protein [Hanamia caeni]|uniref:PIN domain-containing protein n=1 Tax=Hanamia caeni TaxID=2294116 RepID=UPI003742F0E3